MCLISPPAQTGGLALTGRKKRFFTISDGVIRYYASVRDGKPQGQKGTISLLYSTEAEVHGKRLLLVSVTTGLVYCHCDTRVRGPLVWRPIPLVHLALLHLTCPNPPPLPNRDLARNSTTRTARGTWRPTRSSWPWTG